MLDEKTKKLLKWAHYGAYYCSAVGSTLRDGLMVKKRTITVLSKKEAGKMITTVTDNSSGKVLFEAAYYQEKIGNAFYPDFKFEDVIIVIYVPGEWEKVMSAIYQSAREQQARFKKAQVEGYGWI